jgi:hypothetical protein
MPARHHVESWHDMTWNLHLSHPHSTPPAPRNGHWAIRCPLNRYKGSTEFSVRAVVEPTRAAPEFGCIGRARHRHAIHDLPVGQQFERENLNLLFRLLPLADQVAEVMVRERKFNSIRGIVSQRQRDVPV